MKRYIAQFHKGGFPELYHVAEKTKDGWIRVGEPKARFEAEAEADARNSGTWQGEPQLVPFVFSTTEAVSIYGDWLPGTFIKP